MKNVNNKFKIFSKSIFFILVLVLLFLSIAYIPNANLSNGGVNLRAGTWNSDLAEIKNINNNNSYNYKTINDFIDIDSESGLVTNVKNPTNIVNENSIIMLENGLDIYYFSEVCNPKLANGTVNAYSDLFLGYNYTLGADINYEDASTTFKMLRPIGWQAGHPFNGTFDGRGFTISNIFYRPMDDADEYHDTYEGMIYVAWFSQNSGTIKNLGIINPNVIQYDMYDPAVFVSPFVGANDGLVENCFVQDLRGNGSGLLAEGGYDMSMFAATNLSNGKILNCYAACDRISSSSVVMTSAKNRYPFIGGNTGIIKNCYYDDSILVTSKNTYNHTLVIDGLSALKTSEFLSDKFNYASNVWYSDYNYDSEYAKILKLKYPVLKGLATKQVGKDKYFLIENVVDFVYMSQLIDEYQIFRSAKYMLTTSVDLNTVNPNSFVFTNSVFSGELIGGTKAEDGYVVDLANNQNSQLNSIINLKIEKGTSYNGYHCYGLFGIMNGKVKDINIVNATINQNDLAVPNYNELNSIGTVCGLLTGGEINNVHVKTDISLNENGNNTYLGIENVGGICGTAIKGKILNCTTNGTITAPVYDNPLKNTNNFEHSIGGILGKVINNDGISNCLNNIIITAPRYLNDSEKQKRQFIGGVIGSGSINNANQLQNNANISVTDENYRSVMYIGGVIGRVDNATGINGTYLNNADIQYYANNNNYKAYISGVMNIISYVADKYDVFNKTINVLEVQEAIDSVKIFEFTSLTNAGTLDIKNNITENKFPAKYSVIKTSLTNGMDIRAAGVAYSYLTNFNVLGAYNLNKHYVRQSNGTIKSINYTNPQSIDFSLIDEFAPTFNADNQVAYKNNMLHVDTNYLSKSNTITINTEKLKSIVNLERVYNYRDINYITEKNINAYTLQLSGNINGHNFNLINIRNEGNIKVFFSHDCHLSMKMNESPYKEYFGDYKKLKVFGVMEEVSLDCRAKDIYNGGNITISTKNNIVPNFNLYIAGICYKNVGNDPAVNEKLMIKRGYVGSLHNCVNNGDIRITKGNIINNDNITAAGDFYGQSRVGGITCINSSTISSTFNLGNISNINKVHNVEKDLNEKYGHYPDTGDFEVESGGICFIMQNEKYNTDGKTTRGNIIDSANNGNIVSMNTGNSSTWTNAGGFVGRNDRSEDGPLVIVDSSVSKAPHLQKIEYSINYGNVYAYNNSGQAESEQQSKAAGFVCLGACTIVDVINYGQIYSDRVSSGMFGYLMMDRMITAAHNFGNYDPMYIANAINYGIVRNIQKTSTNMDALYDVNENTKITTENPTNSYEKVAGSLIGMLTGISSDDDLSFMNIKNLINFNDDLNILGYTAGVTYGFTSAGKRKAMENMATTKKEDSSPAPFNSDRYFYQYGIKSYSKDTAKPNHDLNNKFSKEYNGGIYNIDYTLRTAPDLTYINGVIDSNNTDNFIADYIQFIPYSKVNDHLIKKIGLESVVLENAIENAKNNYIIIHGILDFLTKNNDSKLNTIYNDLIKNYSNRLNAVKDDLVKEIEQSFTPENYNLSELQSLLNILINNNGDFKNVCTIQDVKDIIIKLTNNMKINEINTFLDSTFANESSNNYLLDIINNRPEDFKAYIDIIATAADFNDTDMETLKSIYYILTSDNNSLNAYINSLTIEEKNKLSSELYGMLKSNQNIKDALITLYPNVQIENEKDLQDLLNIVLHKDEQGLLVKNNNITDEEYDNIYNDLYSQNNNPSVIDKINSLTSGELHNLIIQMKNEVNNGNNKLYNFLDSGRINSLNLLLPATKANNIELINKSNYVVVNQNNSSPDVSTGDLIYSGEKFSIDNTTTNSNSSIKIILNQIQKQGLFNNFAYMLEGNELNLQRWSRLGEGPENIFKIDFSTITGVYAQKDAPDKLQPDLYNYSNVLIYKYIDYSNSIHQKHNLDLTKYMLIAMDLVDSTTYRSILINYLKNIYSNSISNKIAFENILFNTDLEANISISDKLNFINANTNINNYNIVLNNITSKAAKYEISNKFIDNYSEIINQLLIELNNLNTSDGNNKIKEIVSSIFVAGSSSLTNKTTLIEDMKYIIQNLSLDDKKDFLIKFIDLYDDDLLKYFINNNKLSREDYIIIICEMLNLDIHLLSQFHGELKNKFKRDTKLVIAAYIIKGDTNLFKDNIYNGTDLDELIKLMKDAGLSENQINTITDFTGIYAMSSSYGIEDGLFLPDNIKLNDLDPIIQNDNGQEVTDHTWRGGDDSNPNGYNSSEKDKVNYKVYYEMKQLKKSIATRVFKIELIGSDGNGLDESIIIKNNIDTDYIYDGKQGKYEVNFFIPRNHDILKKDKLYIYTKPGHFELSYGATFDESKGKFELTLDKPYSISQKMSKEFVVQAEDTNVKTTYKLNVIITTEARFEPFKNMKVNGVNANYTSENKIVNNVTITNVKATNLVNGYDGKIEFTYGTVNMANGFDLRSNINVYRTGVDSINNILLQGDYTDYTNPLNKLELNSQYYLSNVDNNGIVYIAGEKGTGFDSSNNTYKPGIFTLSIELDNNLSKGVFVIEVVYNSDLKYYVFFEKAASNKANLDEIVYNGYLFKGGEGITDNSGTNMSKHPFGNSITKADFMHIDEITKIPSYLDKLVISPLAKFTVDDAKVKKQNGKQVYTIKYTITAEDGVTNTTFTHYITEEDYSTDIEKVYKNGRVVKTGPFSKGTNEFIYSSEFEKQESPSYKVEYNLNGFYITDSSHYFDVKLCDSQGNIIENSDILNSITLDITEGRDYEVIFSNDSPSIDYYFKLIYENICSFEDNNQLNWHVEFDPIKLSKLKNRDSYLDNVVFNSESVIASTRTMIDNKNITLDDYKRMLKSPERPIVCLPGKIYYNDLEYNLNKQENFYVIGLVSKTMLDFYTPTFTLPEGAQIYRSETFGTEIFNYVPYYVDDNHQLTIFLVNEDGTKFKNELGVDITVITNENGFVYNDINYKLSPVAGYPTIVLNDELIENTSLMTNYNESGYYNEDENRFEYVTYRTYAEIYSSLNATDNKADFVTNYHIATQDITNNIKFNIIIDKADGCHIENASYNVFAEFVCYSLITGGTENETARDDQYELNNRAGLFAYFEGNNIELSHNSLQSNTSGWYKLNLFLPYGYTFKFTVGEKQTEKPYEAGEEFFIKSSFVARTINIHITIKQGTVQDDHWGVHHEDDSIVKK